MDLKLRRLAAALLLSPPPSSAAAADLAVHRATSSHNPTTPPSPQHLDALLAFGRGSRLHASALASSLSARLATTSDAAVALKSLLTIRLLLISGSFILRDQLFAFLHRHPSSGRNPLALSSFPLGRNPASFSLASWVRFSAGLLELLLLLPDKNPNRNFDQLVSLTNADLIAEIAAFAAVAEQIRRAPPASSAVEGNGLIWETVRLAEEDRVNAEKEMAARVKEMGERVDSVGFGDLVELGCVLKRVEECADWPSDWKWTALDERAMCEIRKLRKLVESVVGRRGEEERRVRREPASMSARVSGYRVGIHKIVRSGSSRWVAQP